ncbi:MAG: DUF2813 domain-containing protein [Phycisphaerales bacterium]|nr:DUF2813 domain-containing protein [Phycisphaerales bacterium]
MRVRSVAIRDFRALRAADLAVDGNAMLIGESGAGCSTLMLAVDRVLGAAPRDGLVEIAEQDFHCGRSGARARALSIDLALERTPGVGWPSALAGVVDADESALHVRVRGELGAGGARAEALLVRGGREEALGEAALGALRRSAPSFFLDPESFRAALREPGAAPGPAPADDAASRLVSEVRRIAALGSAASASDVAGALGALRAFVVDWAERASPGETAPTGEALGARVGPIPMPALETIDLVRDPEDPRAAALLMAIGVLCEVARSRPSEPDASPILLLDNIGAGLHPRWLAALAAIVGGLPGQRIVHSHSAELISWVGLETLRRVETVGGVATVRSVNVGSLSGAQSRRIAHHIRRTRAGALLSRCWLLVEGESEAWLLPEFAHLLGVDLRVEGVQCVEFAQAGLDAMVRLADMLGIGWVLLVDGDEAGASYAGVAESMLGRRPADAHIVRLPARDIERCLYGWGFARVYEKAAGRGASARLRRAGDPQGVIRAAIKAKSKPDMAIAVLEEAHRRGPDATPPEVRRVIEIAVAKARGRGGPWSVGDGGGARGARGRSRK